MHVRSVQLWFGAPPAAAGLRSHRLVFAALTLLQRALTEIDGGPYDGVVGRGAPPRAVVRQWKAASRRRYPLLLLPERVTPGCMSSLVEGSASASVASLLRNGAAASSQRLPARIVRLKVSDGWFTAVPFPSSRGIGTDVLVLHAFHPSAASEMDAVDICLSWSSRRSGRTEPCCRSQLNPSCAPENQNRLSYQGLRMLVCRLAELLPDVYQAIRCPVQPRS